MELCQKFGLIREVRRYNHKPGSVVENKRVKILWDFNIQTDHVIQHRRPDIFVLYKTERNCHLIDIAVPGNKRIELKEQKKIDSYSELGREMKKIWNLSQVVIGALGVTSKKLKNWLKKLRGSIEHLQNAALLGTAKIVRQVIET